MSDDIWVRWIPIATGAIGAITGVSGCVMGYISLHKANKIKKLDLRLELRKAIVEARISISLLSSCMENAKLSRQRMSSTSGGLHSGAMVAWMDEFDSNRSAAEELEKLIPDQNVDFNNCSPYDLESQLISIHEVQLKIANGLEIYKKCLEADDDERKQIMARVRNLR